jgi:aspartyl protease family protein
MLRKLVILGICAGTSASIPILYQSNPELFKSFLESSEEAPAPDTQATAAVPRGQPAKPVTEQLLGKKVRLAADNRGHFSAEFKLNGRRVEALVDTGATLVAINVSTARRIGIVLKAEDYKYTVDTANGPTRAAAVNIDNLQIGRIFVEDVQAVVLDDAALNGTLMGMSFLKRLTKFQVEDGALLLVQ